MKSIHLLGNGLLLPKLYVVGNEHYWFLNAAKRAAYGTNRRVEVLHIEEAWQIVHNKKWVPAYKELVDWHFDQTGELYQGFLFWNWDIRPEKILAEE